MEIGAGVISRRIEEGHTHVSHFPPGTSKWNKIEHRLFSYITTNWRAKPLISLQVIDDLIGATKTSTGLKMIFY